VFSYNSIIDGYINIECGDVYMDKGITPKDIKNFILKNYNYKGFKEIE